MFAYQPRACATIQAGCRSVPGVAGECLHALPRRELHGYNPQTLEAMTKPSYREYRRRAVEDLQQMAEEGSLLLEQGRTPEGADGYIILPPEGFGLPMPMPSMPMLEAG